MKTDEWRKAIAENRLSYEWAPLSYTRNGQRVELEIIADCVKAYGIRMSAGAEAMQLVADAIGACMPTALIHEMKWRKSFQLPPLTRPYDYKDQGQWSRDVDEVLRIYGVSSKSLVSGYYKTWVLDKLCNSGGHSGSAPIPRGINHGFKVHPLSCEFTGINVTWRGIKVDTAPATLPGMGGTEYATYMIQNRGTRHGLQQDDYSQVCADLIRNVRIDGKPVSTHMFYTMYDCSTHDGVSLSFSRQPGVPAATPEPEPLVVPIADSFSNCLLAYAKHELTHKVQEDPLGSNNGARIKQYAALYNLTPPLNWCGVGVGFWIHQAAKEFNVKPPIKGSPSARAYEAQFRAIGKWLCVTEARINKTLIKPGSVVVWKRPPETWTGHVGVVADTTNGVNSTFATIEPNSGSAADRVAMMNRRWDDPNLLGFGIWNLVEPIVSGRDPIS